MKRLTIILIAINLSISVTALSAPPAPVFVSPLPSGFNLGVTANYLQPCIARDDLEYVIVNNAISNQFSTIDPDYDWGFGLTLGYVFPCTSSDLNLSYYHLNTNDNNRVTSNGVNDLIPVVNTFNFALIDPDRLNPAYTSAANATIEYQFDQVDLTAGQFVNIGCHLTLHPFLGVRWLQLQRELNTYFIQSSLITSPATILQTQHTNFFEKSHSQSIGPLAGFDTNYCIACGFGVVGHFATALLMGNHHISTEECVQQIIAVPNSVSDSITNSIAITATNRNYVMPVFNMKLGADYTWYFNKCCHSGLTLEIGWMFNHYFNGVDRLATTTVIENAGQGGDTGVAIASVAATSHSTFNIGLNGPYASLVFHL